MAGTWRVGVRQMRSPLETQWGFDNRSIANQLIIWLMHLPGPVQVKIVLGIAVYSASNCELLTGTVRLYLGCERVPLISFGRVHFYFDGFVT
ncbi:hypothetical protein GWI33_016889 [Rhynchophorus ferrugineus]|uniref:Uncharacterized protein n=1 Tax=Rhynchophorus ferrugineus TaxID=354439 RepID=A0A834M6Q6_RHYFE|nr:hypothetical protein GWI33_016889 [Rhynchophorus ferrugineus]